MSAEVEDTRSTDHCIVTPVEFLWHGDHCVMEALGVREAMCRWAHAHGIDPKRVPAHELIVRDEERCQVRCTYFKHDEEGNRIRLPDTGDGQLQLATVVHVAQGETPPMPWPDVVLELMEANRA